MYKLHKETYYLAVNFIDRFLLATEKIKTSKLQLVGVTALFMASKIEVGKMIVWCRELHGAKDWTVLEKYAAVVVYCDLFLVIVVADLFVVIRGRNKIQTHKKFKRTHLL